VQRRDVIHHLPWGGAAVATGSVDAERIVAASGHAEAHACWPAAQGHARTSGDRPSGEDAPSLGNAHRSDPRGGRQVTGPWAWTSGGVVGVRRHLAGWQDTPAAGDLDERLRGITWAPV
jgi:hypothetical protein